MDRFKRAIAALQLLLIAPAVLFMAALVVRGLQPQEHEPARTAARIIQWYSARPHLGLWVLLIALPLAALLLGGATLVSGWNRDPEISEASRRSLALIRAHFSMLLIAVVTLGAGAILLIVGVHVLAN